MNEINAYNQCDDLRLTPPFAFDEYNSQGIDGCDNDFFNEIWPEIASMNLALDWNTCGLSTLDDAKDPNVLPLCSENNKHCDDVTVTGGFQGWAGDSSISSESTTTQSECASPNPDAGIGFFNDQWTADPSGQTNISTVSALPQPCADFLYTHEEQSQDTRYLVNDNESRKRRRSILSVEDEDSGDKQSTHRHVEQKRMLACPYRKLDPHRHRDCLKYTLHRIKDVKQHIDRRHSCEVGHKPCLEGVTDEQRRKLNKTSSRNKSLELQWFNMWDILFPGKKRPRSAFSGNYIEEVVHLIRDCWDDKSSTLIGSAIRKHGDIPIDKDLLDKVMGTLFKQLEEEVCSPSPSGVLNSKMGDVGPDIAQRAPKRSRTQ
ncbi:hypothetical protein INS49_003007 [Diaporthe citri]|uniref:uncharacterized protein n=1 Tax=Diaporthe citri TaxID=83186 RepID=UPI001C81518B|nr:uncharacterized protein INS49_003007 [Diaporthe citri]KAG6368793.1 hypothetical protein INS49_003007 [Diaporthe citri]